MIQQTQASQFGSTKCKTQGILTSLLLTLIYVSFVSACSIHAYANAAVADNEQGEILKTVVAALEANRDRMRQVHFQIEVTREDKTVDKEVVHETVKPGGFIQQIVSSPTTKWHEDTTINGPAILYKQSTSADVTQVIWRSDDGLTWQAYYPAKTRLVKQTASGRPHTLPIDPREIGTITTNHETLIGLLNSDTPKTASFIDQRAAIQVIFSRSDDVRLTYTFSGDEELLPTRFEQAINGVTNLIVSNEYQLLPLSKSRALKQSSYTFYPTTTNQPESTPSEIITYDVQSVVEVDDGSMTIPPIELPERVSVEDNIAVMTYETAGKTITEQASRAGSQMKMTLVLANVVIILIIVAFLFFLRNRRRGSEQR